MNKSDYFSLFPNLSRYFMRIFFESAISRNHLTLSILSFGRVSYNTLKFIPRLQMGFYSANSDNHL